MSDLEKLNILLAVRDREFAKAMERNQRRMERFAKNSQKGLSGTAKSFDMMGAAAKAAAPLLAALGAGAVIGRLRETIAALDDIGKTADKIGLTTDALQELRVIAESSGIGQGALDSSLERFTKRLGEAQAGTGAAKKALDQLGLSANYLADIGLDRSLSVIADEMGKISDPTERAALAAALFGREGVAMVNLLREGSDGMARMREEAREMGVVIDEELVRGAEDAQTKLDLMSRVISANLSTALINLAPLLVDAASGIAAVTSAVREFLSGTFQLPELMNADQLREAVKEYDGLESQLARLEQAQAAYNANVEQFGANSEQAAAWAERQAAAQRDLAAALADKRQQEEATNRAVAGISGLAADRDAANERARLSEMGAEAAERERIARERIAHVERITADIRASQGGEISNEQLANVQELANQWEAAQIAASKILNPVQRAGGATRAAKDDALEYAEVLRMVAGITGHADAASLGYAGILGQINAMYDQGAISGQAYAEMIDVVEKKFGEAKSKADSLRDSASSALGSIVTGAQDASDALSSLFSNLANQFANAAFGSLFKGSGLFDAFGDLLSFDGGGYTGNGPRSGGVDGKGGQLAVVHPQETIIDHTKGQTAAPLASAGASGPVNINVTVSGARGNQEVQEMVQAGVRQGLQEYDRRVLPRRVSSVNKDPRRIG